MYNRYVPQTDGSYQRNHIPDPPKPAPPPRPDPKPAEPPCPQPPAPEPPTCPPAPCQTGSAGEFLQGLLPGKMDTGDLLVLLILLLLLSDGSDQAPSALLTLALFFLL